MAVDLDLGGDDAPLGQLEESIERACGLIQKLRAENARLAEHSHKLESRVRGLLKDLAAERRAAAPEEPARLEAAQASWRAERERLAARLESAIRKLDAFAEAAAGAESASEPVPVRK